MSASWRDDDEEFRVGGVRGGLKAKPRFSFTEVKLLLEAVKRNRYIILRKFNRGVSAETKKQTWAEITNQINGLGENHREVRQIMKKWADLKCDGKRRIIALRGPNGSNLRKKNLGPVEKMVHKILMMSPGGDGESDAELAEDDDFSKLYGKGPPSNPASFSYLNLTDGSYPLGGGGGVSFDISPLSSPEKELGGDPFHSASEFDLDLADDGDRTLDLDDNEDSLFTSYPDPLPPPSASLDPLPDDAALRNKPVHTYSRSGNPNNSPSSSSCSSRPPPGPFSSSVASTSSAFPDASAALSFAALPPSQSATGSSVTAPSVPLPSSSAANDSTSHPAPSTSSISAPPASCVAVSSSTPSVNSAPSSSVSSSHSHQPSPSSSSSSSALPSSHPTASGSKPSDPLPAGVASRRAHEHVAQVASQSLQQQRASRMLLTSVSQSLETLAQSVQLLVEAQQEFVQESLLLQRETVDILRDFSNTTLTMLRDKASSGQLPAHHRHHPASRY